MTGGNQAVIHRTLQLLPRVKMDFGGRGFLGGRGAHDSPLPSVIKVVPCKEESLEEDDISQNYPDNSSTVRLTGSGTSPMLSPRPIPILLTPGQSTNDITHEDDDNVSLYSRILSARSCPGTPQRSRSRAESRSNETEEEPPTPSHLLGISNVHNDPQGPPRSLAPPNFNRVFSVGGELDSVLKERRASPSRSFSR